jgi:hypothetical protein
MGANIDLVVGEFTKRPEELSPDKLTKAQSLADILTNLRKFLYLFFSFATVFSLLGVAQFSGVDVYIQIIFIMLSIPYLAFKVRDYIRGTI